MHADALATLRREGIVMLPGLVDESAASRLRSHFAGHPLIGPDGQAFLDQVPPNTGMAAYPLRTVLDCTEIVRLVNNETILRLAQDYLGCKPTLSSLGVRWSFPGRAPACDTQLFHRDPDDWRFLKFFVYLTDVDAGSGPHVYVTRTHVTAGTVRGRVYSQAAIGERFGRDRARTVEGPAGTAFIADTHGFHAGLVPTKSPRLILQAQYSLLPVFAFCYAPAPIGKLPELDPYVNRLLIRQS